MLSHRHTHRLFCLVLPRDAPTNKCAMCRPQMSWRRPTLKGLLHVHEHILQRRHLISALKLCAKSIVQGGIHVIKREVQGLFPVLGLALHLARELRRHHVLRAARVRVQPRHRIRRVEVHVIIPRRSPRRRRGRTYCRRGPAKSQILRLLVLDIRTAHFLQFDSLLLLLRGALLVVYAAQNPIVQLPKSQPSDQSLIDT